MWVQPGADLPPHRCLRVSINSRTLPPRYWTRLKPKIFSPGLACRCLCRESFARLKRRQRRLKRWGYPVVVKALGVAHKTDVGGVRLDLTSAAEVSASVTEMSQLSKAFLVEKMVKGVVAELIVGVARDEQFGPYLLVGGGGILVQMIKDSQSLLLPTTRERVLHALGQLKLCASLPRFQRGATCRSERCR